MNKEPMVPEWEEDCQHHYGKVLTGKYSHWCPDWDYLPIDETVHEFEYCKCEFEFEEETNE